MLFGALWTIENGACAPIVWSRISSALATVDLPGRDSPVNQRQQGFCALAAARWSLVTLRDYQWTCWARLRPYRSCQTSVAFHLDDHVHNDQISSDGEKLSSVRR